jgi:hypothetical protein
MEIPYSRYAIILVACYVQIGCTSCDCVRGNAVLKNDKKESEMQLPQSLPEIFCHRTSTAPVIDGRVDDEVWKKAEVIQSFWKLRPLSMSPRVVPVFATRVRCLWDAAVLYVAFECEGPDVWATKTQRDDSLWEEPVVEIFMDVLGNEKSFFEFQVNPLGTVYDSFVPDVSLNAQWQCWSKWNCESLRAAVQVDGRLNDRQHRDNGWSAEFAIPFANIVSKAGDVPTVGDVWRANFCRYDYSAELVKPELSCWAPVIKCFDDMANFGSIIFVD